MNSLANSRAERGLLGSCPRGASPAQRAFTLIELLVVIAVAGILAALSIPAIKQFGKSNQQVAATRQMLDAVGRARQLAIANRTTVYMVFLPNGFLNGNLPYVGNLAGLSQVERDQAYDLAPDQGRSYALLSLRTIGDQPGRSFPQYLSDWTTLPRGWIFATNKFVPRTVTTWYENANTFGPDGWEVKGFFVTNGLPFPNANSQIGRFFLPYIAFDQFGRVTSGKDEYIPLARGTVDPGLKADGTYSEASAYIDESPAFNSLSNYNLIHIDWLTGRAKLEERKIE